MRSFLKRAGAGAALAASVASCSVNPSSLCYAAPVSPGAVPQLIYPVPGYSKVPDGATFIVVAYPNAPPTAQTITLAENNGGTVALGPLGAAPNVIPTPHAAVLPGQGSEFGVTLPALAPHTTYSVNYRFTNTATVCGQTTSTSVLMGTFRTQ
jgi:hypothetical protein